MTTDRLPAMIAASPRDRLDLFLATANRLGTPVGNVEKDFWVCWTLERALSSNCPTAGPRLLFKGGTSLSKAYGLIERFSEDIDVTVFRDDLDEAASRRRARGPIEQETPRQARRHPRRVPGLYHGPALRLFLASLRIADATGGAGRIEIDEADPDGQTLLIWYPEVEPRDGAYVRPAVRIESGAKSALDPNQPVDDPPYIADDMPGLDLAVTNVTTIEASRTFWDKVVIAQGCADGMNGEASCGRKASAFRGTITICIAWRSRTLASRRWQIVRLARIVYPMPECFSIAPTMI